uniref:Peroxiredoxin like 2C n=1 Tax=Callorhinchus milii TaxID=7868 RepID=A0A4W3IG96_CALMI
IFFYCINSQLPNDLLCFLKDAGVRLIVIGQCTYHHIQSFCSQMRYNHNIYVYPSRQIYKGLGMKQGEIFHREVLQLASVSLHVKSNFLSIWRAMNSPAFDFQGDAAQQGGALIVGPGERVHFGHLDMNKLDHTPINFVLQLAGVTTVDFRAQAQTIDL